MTWKKNSNFPKQIQYSKFPIPIFLCPSSEILTKQPYWNVKALIPYWVHKWMCPVLISTTLTNLKKKKKKRNFQIATVDRQFSLIPNIFKFHISNTLKWRENVKTFSSSSQSETQNNQEHIQHHMFWHRTNIRTGSTTNKEMIPCTKLWFLRHWLPA